MIHVIKQLRTAKSFLSLILILLTMSLTSTSAFAQKIHNIVLVHGAFVDGSGWEGAYNNLVKKATM
jgi:hypothetical protein